MNDLNQIIADYRRARLAGLPVDTVELFRQLDECMRQNELCDEDDFDDEAEDYEDD